MFSWSALAVVIVVGTALDRDAPKKAPVGQKIGVFNMAKVLREYPKGKAGAARLVERKTRLDANLIGLRAMLNDLPKPAGHVSAPTPSKVILNGQEQNPPPRIELASGSKSDDEVLLSRLVEDAERKVSRILTAELNDLVSGLYDDIHAAAIAMAKERGLCALLAYMDAVTEEELDRPELKELKLKPPASMPFALHPTADYTEELLARLRGKTGADLPPRPIPPKDVLGHDTTGANVGFFNMAAVMRQYGKVESEVKRLTQKQTDLSKDVPTWKARLVKLDQRLDNPDIKPQEREEIAEKRLKLSRKIEDKEREATNIRQQQTKEIIAGLYDDIHDVVGELAEEKNLSIVMAYPDAVTEKELARADIKELKLKPPAAQPFYLDPSVDYTGEIIKRLNSRGPTPKVPRGWVPPAPQVPPAQDGPKPLKFEQPAGRPFIPPAAADDTPATPVKHSAPVKLPPIPKVDSDAKPAKPDKPKATVIPKIPLIPAVEPGKK